MKNILALVWWSDMHYATNTILSTWEKNSIFVEKCAQYLKFNFNFQFRLAKITSWAKNFVHPHLPESYPISLSWKQILFDLQTKGTPHRRKTVFFRALPKLPLPTRAGCRWRAQLDVQISLQHSTLSGGGQGSLSTSFPHPTEGVEDAEELPMVGVLKASSWYLDFHHRSHFGDKIWTWEGFMEQQKLLLITFTLCPATFLHLQASRNIMGQALLCNCRWAEATQTLHLHYIVKS